MWATGLGPMPGEDAVAYADAVRVVLGELWETGELPYLPELPGRGPGAGATGRTLAMVTELGADLQPAGWRLTDAAGVDQRRAASLLAQDLDELEEQAEGYAGALKVQVLGPWSLAARVERPRGDKVLADHGARRDLAQALAEGVTAHVAGVRRRLSGCDRLVVQVDEPELARVLAGRVPTASGFGRHRTVHPPEASAALGWLLDAVIAAGGEPWVVPGVGAPLDLVRGAGAQGLVVALDAVDAADHDTLAEALEAGESVGFTMPLDDDVGSAVDAVRRWCDMLGLSLEEASERLAVAPTAGAGEGVSRAQLVTARRVAAELAG